MSSFLRPPVLALLLLAGANAGLWLTPSQGSSPASAVQGPETVPLQIGDWTGKAIPVDARTIEILETDNVALMEYQKEGEPPVWLARVAGFGNRAAFHPPELCYVGSHFDVLKRERLTMKIGGQNRQFMRLEIRQGDELFEAWYWFTAGRRITANYYNQQWWLLLGMLGGHPLSGTLVRVSTPLDDPKRAFDRLSQFMAASHDL